MPRKIDPRWGEDGFFDVEAFSISADDLHELARMLTSDPDAAMIADLRMALENIGTQYRNWSERGPSAFTRAEARKALCELLELASIDHSILFALNERAFDCLHNELLMLRPSPVGEGETVLDALLQDKLSESTLRAAITNAIARLESTKGPDRGGEIPWAVSELCDLYEILTKLPATHSNKGELLSYQSAPRSPAGRFIESCFEHIDPGVRDTQLSHAMRLHIESRR